MGEDESRWRGGQVERRVGGEERRGYRVSILPENYVSEK